MVEDNTDLGELFGMVLKRAGHQVFVCMDAPSALQRFADVRPHLVILDWTLPGMSGLDLLQSIRRIDPHRVSRVIMVTGRAESADVLAAWEAGVDEMVPKPVLPDELAGTVESVLHAEREQLDGHRESEIERRKLLSMRDDAGSA